MVVFNNQLIVGGVFDNAGGVPTSNIASWDGSNWAALQNGLSGQLGTYPSIDCYPLAGINGCINSLAIYNNELYAGGKFSNASGITVNNIAKWNGSSWSDVGGGIRFNNSSGGAGSYISSMAVYNNALHVVGLFDTAGVTVVRNLAKWDGVSWSDVGGGIGGSSVLKTGTLLVHSNSLVVGGSLDTVGNVAANNIANWNGSAWSTFGFGIPDYGGGLYDNGVTDLAIFGGSIFAGNRTTGVSWWNGTSWQSVGGGLSMTGSSGTAYSAIVSNNQLVVGGAFGSAGLIPNVSNIAVWDGSSWGHLTPPSTFGSSGLGGCVGALCIYNGYLYAGGTFGYDVVNASIPLKGVARLNASVGLNDSANERNVSIGPNPAHDMISLNLNGISEITNFTMTNSMGQVIHSQKRMFDQHQIELSSYPSGIYFMTFEAKNERLTRKLVLE